MRTTPSPAHRRPRAGAALRWLLMMLLAFDLGSAPLHRHHHAGGIEGLAQMAQVTVAAASAMPAGAGADHHADFTHGTAVLRADERAQDVVEVAVAPDPARHALGPAGRPSGVPPPAGVLDVAPRLDAAPDTRTALHRSLPPESHAPPTRA